MVISILLLILGVASTFALTYVQTELEEPWGAQYTLQYTGSSIKLSNPQTTINDDDSVTVEFDITPSDKDVKCKFIITPLDINNDAIEGYGETGSTQIHIDAVGSPDIHPSQKVYSAGADMTYTYSMVELKKIEKLSITWGTKGSSPSTSPSRYS